MHVIHRRGWEIPEHQATPEGVFLNRRALLGAGAGLAAATLVPGLALGAARRRHSRSDQGSLSVQAQREVRARDRPITPEEINANYNNFYEFGTTKNVTKAAQQLQDPAVDGEDRRHGGEAVRDRRSTI